MTILDSSDLRREVRKSVASTLSAYPRIDGTGIVTPSSAAFVVYDSAGASLQASTSATLTAIEDVGSRLDMAIPAIAAYQEDARVEYSFVYSGATYTDVVYFDVVRDPMGPSRIDLDGLKQLEPGIGERIKAQAKLLDQGPEQRASSLAHLARVTLCEWIRAQVSADALARASTPSTTTSGSVPIDAAYLRPRLLLDRARLHGVEIKIAMAYVYRADKRAGDEEDEGADAVAAQEKAWMEAARSSFATIGALKYDASDDGVPDTVIEDLGRTVKQRRVQS